MRRHGVVRARQPGNAVKQYHHVAVVLHEALGALDGHFRHDHMALGGFVERRADDLGLDRSLHVGDFFRPLVDEQNDEKNLRVVRGNRVGDVFEQHGLAGARRRDDKPSLTFTDRSGQIDDPRGDVLYIVFEVKAFIGKQRRQVVEVDFFLAFLGVFVVDHFHAQQGKITFGILGRPYLSGHRVSGP